MLSKDYLINEFTSPLDSLSLDEISDMIISENLPLSELIELNFHKERRISFRSAWVLEKIAFKDINYIAPVFEDMLNRFNKIHNPSLARHYNKILLQVFYLRRKNALPEELKIILKKSNPEIIIEGCFKWILTPRCPVATLVWSIDILLNYVDDFPWLKEELPPIIQRLNVDSTPGLKNYCSKILKKSNIFNHY